VTFEAGILCQLLLEGESESEVISAFMRIVMIRLAMSDQIFFFFLLWGVPFTWQAHARRWGYLAIFEARLY